AARLRAGAETTHRSVPPARATARLEEARRLPPRTPRPLRADTGSGGMAPPHDRDSPAVRAVADRRRSPRRPGPPLHLPQRGACRALGPAQGRAAEGRGREVAVLAAARRGRPDPRGPASVALGGAQPDRIGSESARGALKPLTAERFVSG